MSKLQQKPSPSKENIRPSKHEIFKLFSIFVSLFCSPGSGCGLRIQPTKAVPDPADQNQCGSGYETLEMAVMTMNACCLSEV